MKKIRDEDIALVECSVSNNTYILSKILRDRIRSTLGHFRQFYHFYQAPSRGTSQRAALHAYTKMLERQVRLLEASANHDFFEHLLFSPVHFLRHAKSRAEKIEQIKAELEILHGLRKHRKDRDPGFHRRVPYLLTTLHAIFLESDKPEAPKRAQSRETKRDNSAVKRRKNNTAVDRPSTDDFIDFAWVLLQLLDEARPFSSKEALKREWQRISPLAKSQKDNDWMIWSGGTRTMPRAPRSAKKKTSTT